MNQKHAPSIQTATSLQASPTQDRHDRMIKYSVAMGIRMACIPFIFILPGYWRIIPALGVMILPYIAVVIANVGSPGASEAVQPVATPLALSANEPQPIPSDNTGI